MSLIGNITRYFLLLSLAAGILLCSSIPALAVNNESTIFGDPKEYFPSCACSSVFICFVIWMVAMIIIAMYQYSESKGKMKKKKLSPLMFSIIAIVLLFLIFSAPLWIMTGMLKLENFPVNPESGNYEFSELGEKAADSKLGGSYSKEELRKHVKNSHDYMVMASQAVAIACGIALLTIPAYINYRARRKAADFSQKKKKKRSQGRIGTRKK